MEDKHPHLALLPPSYLLLVLLFLAKPRWKPEETGAHRWRPWSASHGHEQSRAKSKSGEGKRSCLAQLCLAQSFAKSYFTPLPSFNLSPHSNQSNILKSADFPSYLTPSSGSPQGLTCTRSRDVCLTQGTGWPLNILVFFVQVNAMVKPCILESRMVLISNISSSFPQTLKSPGVSVCVSKLYLLGATN